MEILLDTANVEKVKKYNDIYNIVGVTTNPTIISREKADFFSTLQQIRDAIGKEKQLHVQVTALCCEEIQKEAECICSAFGGNTYIKVPTNQEGIKAIKQLKQKGFNVTATAIYTVQQAMLAASVNADYVAPYFNRMCNCNYNAVATISDIAKLFSLYDKKTKIIAASFKNSNQIMQALLAGAEAITASPDLYTTMVENSLIDAAISDFKKDWTDLYGDKRIYDL